MLGDWLEGTIDLKKTKNTVIHTVSNLQAYFAGLGLTWLELDRGSLGYSHSAKVGSSIRVSWSPERAEMGVHITMPASGLAEIGASFESICSDFYHLGMKASRLDIAGDDFEGVLDLRSMAAKVERGEFVCRGKSADLIKSLWGGSGCTIAFGKRESQSYLRVYDKAAEQADKGKGVFTSWIRVELESKGDRAQAIFLQIVTNPEGWRELALGWLRSYLEFKEVGEPSQKTRWQASAFWLEFLDNASKLRLVLPGIVKTIEDVREWVKRQVVPSLYALGQTIGWEKVFSDILEGEYRVSKSLESLMLSFRAESELIGVAS